MKVLLFIFLFFDNFAMEKKLPGSGCVNSHRQISIPAQCIIHIIAQTENNLKIKTKDVPPKLPKQFRKLAAPKLDPKIKAALKCCDAIAARKTFLETDFSRLLIIFCNSTHNYNHIEPYTCYRTPNASYITINITAQEKKIDIKDLVFIVPTSAKIIVESKGDISLFSREATGEIFYYKKDNESLKSWNSTTTSLLTTKNIILKLLKEKESSELNTNKEEH